MSNEANGPANTNTGTGSGFLAPSVPPALTPPKEKRTSISRKLFAAMAIPVLFVALIAGSRVVEAKSQLNSVEHQTNLALATGGPNTLVARLLDERNVTGLEMLGTSGVVKLPGVTTSKAARVKTDQAMSDFKKFLDNSGSEVRSIYLPAYNNTSTKLAAVRKDYDDYTGLKVFNTGEQSPANQAQYTTAKQLYDAYSDIVQLYIAANAETISRIDDATLRNRATAIADQTATNDLLSRISRTAALAVLTGNQATVTDQVDAGQMFAQYQTDRKEAIAALDGDKKNQDVLIGYYQRSSFLPFDTTIRTYLQDGKMDVGHTLNLMQAAAGTQTANGKTVGQTPTANDASNAAIASLQARADQLTSSARSKVWSNVLLFLFSAGVSVVAAYLISRTISKPLLSLADQANVMSSTLLPDAVHDVLSTPIGREIVEPKLSPITVASHDEVSDVAVALTEVQDRALSLAVEQAALRHNFADAFVSLGRRVQGLVLRQLEFITDLEDSESSEANLANLFKLDHIATRVRRNAESLIVLGGSEQRTTGRVRPMEAIDTVRAAVSEVEDYQRIDMGVFDEARLPGDVATDLSHIIAELLENGLMFSPPDRMVDVAGRREPSGYTFTVVDRGIGMNREAIDRANMRLAAEESFAVSPSRYLGHYIAGHLAERIGAQIRLIQRADGGTIATIFIPESVLINTRRTQPAPG